jgi:hypothetical protein
MIGANVDFNGGTFSFKFDDSNNPIWVFIGGKNPGAMGPSIVGTIASAEMSNTLTAIAVSKGYSRDGFTSKKPEKEKEKKSVKVSSKSSRMIILL